MVKEKSKDLDHIYMEDYKTYKLYYNLFKNSILQYHKLTNVNTFSI